MNPALARHLQTLGLERSPFPPTPDAAAYYATSLLEAELVEATHALSTRAGFVLLTGEIGTGKSTFIRRLLSHLETDGMVVSLVFNTFLQGDDLLAAVLRDFGLEPRGNAANDIEILNRFLISRWQAQTTCVLIIDDAQNLSLASLELVRLLTSLETGQEKLLQIVLSGQPELRDNLDQPQIRQLTSRICKHVRLEPLDSEQTRHYVEFRLKAAGAEGRIKVSNDAIAALHRSTGGNQRHIHMIMDRCLYGLYGQPEEHRVIDATLVKAAASQAGALPARAARRFAPITVAAAIGLAVSLGVAGMLIGSTTTPVDAKNVTSPPVSARQTPRLQVSSDVEWEACLDHQATGQRRDWVPAAAVNVLRNTADVCSRQIDGRWQIAWAPPSNAAAFQSPQTVDAALRGLQKNLTSLGHYDGAIDGQFGRMTSRALARFQQSLALPPSGDIDPLTLLLLDASNASSALTSRTTEPNDHVND